MNCEELNGLLDRLMDGELSDEQRREMEAHGAGCPECAAAVRSAEQLKALFDEMEPEVDVPLQAQAGWRSAVRAESRQRNRKKLARWIGSAAAAVVVLAGVGLALNLRGAPQQKQSAALTVADEAATAGEDTAYELAEEAEEIAYEAVEAPRANAALVPVAVGGARVAETEAEDFAAAESAVVETDGAAVPAAEAAGMEEAAESEADAGAGSAFATAQPAPACELSLKVEDVDTACERICDLVEEYEGSADVQPLEEGGANVYVEINANDAGDFISAVMPLDASGQTHALPEFSEGGRVMVLLVVKG